MENTTKTSQKLSFWAVAEKLLANLPDRSRAIMRERFGLSGGDRKTLEKIGRDNRVTRERVRQIISDSLKKVGEAKDFSGFKEAEEKIIWTIGEKDGIMEEKKLFEILAEGDQREVNAVLFLGSVSNKLFIGDEKGSVKKVWAENKALIQKAKEVGKIANEVFRGEDKLLTDSEIAAKVVERNPHLSKTEALNFLAVLEGVKKNKFGKWGVTSWKEVTPKGTKERVYLVLKESGKPMHFTEIAKLIDNYGLGKKKAHPQTVHNELIKDNRFVLIGRGIYALREWGYEEGTIKDVLEGILKKSTKPLSKEEILEKVMEIRKVKKATVMINLNNPQVFVKVNNGYSIKK